MATTEAEQVCTLLESVVDAERTATEVSQILEINCGVIERVADRLAEIRLGIPSTPADPDDVLDWAARRFFLVMRRRWDD